MPYINYIYKGIIIVVKNERLLKLSRIITYIYENIYILTRCFVFIYKFSTFFEVLWFN